NQKYSGSRSEASKADKALLTLYDNLIPVITALEPQYCHYTNGPLEGINRKIKQIQRTAYGYRNFEHLKARIYLQTYLGKDTRSSVKIA
ncbi:transposase, partial [Ligilactobacillus murinus]